MAEPIQSAPRPNLQHLLRRPLRLHGCVSLGPLQTLPRVICSSVAPVPSPAIPLILEGQWDEGLEPAVTPPLEGARPDCAIRGVGTEEKEIAKEVQIWRDPQEHLAQMGEGGEDHNGVGDEVREVDPIVTEHV